LKGLEMVLKRLFLRPVFIEQIDSGWLYFALFYIGAGVAGVQIVYASFLLVLFYQQVHAKCSVFLEAVPDWGTNKRNREGVK
jgi:hypothetical protein